MKRLNFFLACTVLVLSGCTLTQKPVSVSDSAISVPAVSSASVEPSRGAVPESPRAVTRAAPLAARDGMSVDQLTTIAKIHQKNPAALKAYIGQTLHGQAKFIRTAKGNPNAVVADVRVSGLGEASLWCRNILGNPAPNRLTGFEGTLTGDVYTSEDFSHDVYLKDCRFRD